jgi:hypothetical protein
MKNQTAFNMTAPRLLVENYMADRYLVDTRTV